MAKYLDKYPDCVECPVSQYCGTVVSSIRLCNSYPVSEGEKILLKEELYEVYTDALGDDWQR